MQTMNRPASQPYAVPLTAVALLMLSVGTRELGRAAAIAILFAPVLAVAALWANYGYFPITIQVEIAAVSAAIGALAGLALRRNLIAAIGVVVLRT